MFTEAGNSTYFRCLRAIYKYMTQSKAGRLAHKPMPTCVGIRLWSCVAGVGSDTSFPDKPLQLGGNYKEYYVKQVLTKGIRANRNPPCKQQPPVNHL